MLLPMIDTLISIIDIENYNQVTTTLKEKLDRAKHDAKTALSENSSKIISIKIGQMDFEVLSNGKKGYSYILHNDLYEINLAQYRSKNPDFYPVYVKIKSEALWSMGPLKAWEYIYRWVTYHVGQPITSKISRIDLCCHTDEICLSPDDMEKFKGQFYTDNTYRHRRKINAMCFGSSSSNKIYCRIYDKVLEITQKKTKTWFYNIWKDKKLNCKKVWNVEFQINREFLKDHYIETVFQAFDRLGSLWEYCTKHWLVKIELDNENISRCSINETWKGIQKAFNNFKHEELIKREKQLSAEAESMVPSTFGNITTFAAKKGITDPKLALTLLQINGEQYLQTKKEDFKSIVKKKQKMLDIQGFKRNTYLNNENVEAFPG